MEVHIFIPCFVDQLFPSTAFNMVKVLQKAGCTVVYNKNQTCCGQPAFNAGYTGDSCAVAEKFVKDFESAEYIVSPSASCIGFVKNHYEKLLPEKNKHKLAALQSKCYEFTEFLTEVLTIENFDAVFPAQATYHDSCAALRECGIKEGPRKLLSNVKDLSITEMDDVETCCGFGGTFSVKFENISAAMGEQKVLNAIKAGATHIISTDCSCLMQIQGIIDNKNLELKTVHIADVLAAGW